MTKIQIIVFAVLIGLCGLLSWKVDSQSNKIDTLSEQLETANTTIEKHRENIRITENATNEYIDRIAVLNADVDRLLKRPVRCVTVTRPPLIRDGQGQRGKHDGDNGVRSDWLYDYSAKAERLRIERNSCKDFVNEIYRTRQND